VDLVQRVKNICLSPAMEWPVIAGEATPTATLITGYVVPLAALSAVAGFIGGSVVGYSVPFVGTYRVPIVAGLVGAVFAVAMAVVGVFVLSLIINALAPKFGAEPDSAQAMKVAVYSFTPAWLAGVLQIVPPLSVLAILGALYGLYVLYLGLPQLMKAPQDKAVAYTAVVVVCAVVMMFVLSLVGGLVVGGGAMGAGAMGRGVAESPSALPADSALGRLERGLEEAARKMEAAEKSGDQSAQVDAAFEGLGALLGGGSRVEPLAIDQLKPFVPETFAGLPRTANSAERTGMGGLMIAKAEATYGDGAEKRVQLEITDSGGASGLMGLASWAGVESEREDEYSSERTSRVDNRLVHEKMSKTGGAHEFGIVLGDRFMVSAEGQGVTLDELKAAVSTLDLGRLEAMKDVGR
jgi:uncharacterized membrane protein